MGDPTVRVVRHVTQFGFCLESAENTGSLQAELDAMDRSDLEWLYLESLRLVFGYAADKAAISKRSVEAELGFLLDAAIASRNLRGSEH